MRSRPNCINTMKIVVNVLLKRPIINDVTHFHSFPTSYQFCLITVYWWRHVNCKFTLTSLCYNICRYCNNTLANYGGTIQTTIKDYLPEFYQNHLVILFVSLENALSLFACLHFYLFVWSSLFRKFGTVDVRNPGALLATRLSQT